MVQSRVFQRPGVPADRSINEHVLSRFRPRDVNLILGLFTRYNQAQNNAAVLAASGCHFLPALGTYFTI